MGELIRNIIGQFHSFKNLEGKDVVSLKRRNQPKNSWSMRMFRHGKILQDSHSIQAAVGEGGPHTEYAF